VFKNQHIQTTMMTPIEFIKDNQDGALLNDYSLSDMIWFMDRYAKHYSNTKQKDCSFVDKIIICPNCGGTGRFLTQCCNTCNGSGVYKYK